MSIVLVGSTSGSVTLQEPAVAGTTVLTLPAVSGTVLTDTSPKAGNVLQVVNATYSTETANATNTYADTGLTASITPSSSSSKILVLVNQNGIDKSDANSTSGVFIRLLRGSTELIQMVAYCNFTNTAIRLITGSVSTCYLDSPSTTSLTTYKTQFYNIANASTVRVNSNSAVSTITLLEIAV
jgi:hypothetical protein